MRIGVIGTGYVGLVAGACFSDTGNDVWCVDKDASKIDRLKDGIIPIYEPGLETLVHKNVERGRLHFTTDTKEATEHCDVIFMAVGTPPTPSGAPNLSFLEAASREVGRAMNGKKVVVNKSTVPIGSHETVANWIKSETSHPVSVVSNPEFLKEGTAVDDFLKPDRVVIGTNDEDAYQIMAELYGPFVRQGNPIIWMDPISAEITKYACNAFLATRISFMNELSVLCDSMGGDVENVRRGMVTDVRIGRHFLYPGVGYGGSCFPKDVQALLNTAKANEVQMGIIDAAEEANARQKRYLVNVLKKHYSSGLSGKTFGLWGLAFKPNTDDIREAPALVLIDELIKEGASVRVFDPVAMKNVKEVVGDKVAYCNSMYEAAEGADAAVLVTEWNDFRTPDFERVKSLLKEPVLFDGRNIYDPTRMRRRGFKYYSIGRRPV